MKKIRLLLATLLLVAGNVLSAQTLQVTGTVTDAADGVPVAGASVRVLGTTTGVVTDANGKYAISAARGAVLEIAFIGMETVQVTVGANAVINVQMKQSATQLEDVLVVAYGTAKKSSYTGSAAVVKKEQIEKIQATNLTKSLEGNVAGIQVTGGTGQPGSSTSIRIRGIGSINASSSPLYVVDGAAYDGDINAIPVDDIESVSVLKDAAAGALFGARGANGIIMITTKKGTQGKAKVNAKVNIGVSTRAIPEYDRVNPTQYYELMYEGYLKALKVGNPTQTEAALAAIASGSTSNGIVAKLGGYNPYNVGNGSVIDPATYKLNSSAKLLYWDDWTDALSQAGLRQDYSVSVSGGNDNTTYYTSFGYIDEEGYAKWTNFDRFSGRVNVSSKINNWLKTEASLSGITSNTRGGMMEGTYTTNPFYYARIMGPIYPIYQRASDGSVVLSSDGSPMYDMGGGSSIFAWAGHTRPYAPNSNLVVTLPLDYRGNSRNQLSGRFSAEFSFLKDFTFKTSVASDITNTYYTTYQNNKFGDAESVKGRSTKEYYKIFSYTFLQQLNYNKIVGDHNFAVLLGHENYKLEANDLYATRTGYIVPSNELVNGGVAEGSSSTVDNYTMESILSQVTYSYLNRYFVSASYRYDGSSRFSSDSRWGGFWSIGGSWRAKQESFLADVNWLDDLKVKVSYGQQGNDNVGTYYAYQGLFDVNDRNNNNLNGAWYSQLANNELSWEKNANLNAGIDFAIFGKVRGSVEYFNRESSNLLFAVPLPQSTGINSKWENIGSMYNRGFEAQVAVDIFKNKTFTWTLDVNATTFKNEITKMPLKPDGTPKEIISGSKKLAVGRSIYDYWLRSYAGVDPANGDALYWKDVTVNGEVTRQTTNDQNAATYYYRGTSIPDVYGGITNTFKAFGFDLSVLLSYQLGGKTYDTNYAALMHPGTFGSNWSTDILNRWTASNTTTSVPRLQNGYVAPTAASDRWLVSSSFLSLKNVTFGYTLPSDIAKKIGIGGMRVYATGDNLKLFAKRKGLDPQQTFGGTTDNTYVPARIVSLGLNITF